NASWKELRVLGKLVNHFSMIFQCIYRWQIPPCTMYIHSKTKRITVRQHQTNKIRADRLRSTNILLSKNSTVKCCRTVAQNPFANRGKCNSFVKDIIQHQHHPALHIFLRRHFPSNLATKNLVIVAAHMKIIETEWKFQQRQQLPRKYYCPTHYA